MGSSDILASRVLLTLLKLIVGSSIHFDKPNWARTNLDCFSINWTLEMRVLRRVLNKKAKFLRISPSLPRLDSIRTKS